jgi:hypothetical protein
MAKMRTREEPTAVLVVERVETTPFKPRQLVARSAMRSSCGNNMIAELAFPPVGAAF